MKKLDLDNIKYTEKVVDKYGKLVGEFTVTEFNVFRIKLLREDYKEGYFIEDEDGDLHAIDEFGQCATYPHFLDDTKLLSEILTLQMNRRKKYR